MLGWNIFDRNLTTGGLFGYSSLNSRVNLKVPSYKVIASRVQRRKVLKIINLERSFMRPKNDGIPEHYVVLSWGSAHPGGRILLGRSKQ